MLGDSARLHGCRVVVVGAGIAGVATALVARLLGAEVFLVEQAPHLMPLVRGFRRHGYSCDLGLHYTGGLARRGLLRRLLERWGAWEELEPSFLPGKGFDVLEWNGGSLRVPRGLEAFEESLREAFPGSRDAISAYVQAVRVILEKTPYVDPDTPPGEGWAARGYQESLATFLRRHHAEPAMVRSLGSYGYFLLGIEGERISVRMHALLVGTMVLGPATFRGGGGALATALERALVRHGVVVRTGAEVTAIRSEEGRVRGVRLSGAEEVAADVVVSTIHPANLPRILEDPGLAAAYRRRLDRSVPTPALMVTFVAAEEGSGERNIYCLGGGGGEGDGEALAILRGAPAAKGERSTLALVRSVDRGTLAGARARGRVDYRRMKEEMALEVVKRATERGVVRPGTRPVEVVTPLSFERWLRVEGGAAYGLRRGIGDYHFRPATPVGGLYLAGQSTLMPGVLGACASGLVACGLAAGTEAVWNLLRG